MNNSNMEAEQTHSISEEDRKVADLRQKLMIVYEVLQECYKEQTGRRRNMLLNKTVCKMMNLTTVRNSDVLKTLRQREILNVSEDYNTDMLEQLDFAIRRVLVNLYVNCKEIPTMESIKKMLGGTVSNDLTRQNLKRCGYVWKRLGNTKRAILMEHPKQTVQRQRYFLELNRYREQKRFFVYVDVKVMSKDSINIQCFPNYINAENPYVVFFAVASQKGYVGGTTIASTSVLKCQQLFEEYFIENILPSISEPSVITLEDNPYFRKSLPVPTIESEKHYMIKWLEVNGVPHEKDCHRSELFALIHKCKNKVDLHKFDAVLRGNGHEVLRRPTRSNYLNFFKPLWDTYLSSKTKKKISILKVITEKPSFYWGVLQNYLLSYEKVIYAEDLQIEKVIDKILTIAQTVNVEAWADIECDVEEDNLKQEDCLINILI